MKTGRLIHSCKDDHYLTFDEEYHVYTLDGKLVPGATDVKKGFPEPFQLIQWKIGKGAEFIVDRFREHYAEAKQFPPKNVLAKWLSGAKTATKDTLDRTADIGTLMHDYCWALRTNQAFDSSRVAGHEHEAQILKRLAEVKQWVTERQLTERVLRAEEIIASIKYKFGGKFDCLVERSDGKIILQDYKSAKGFYVEQFIQGGGYSIALKEWLGIKIDGIEIIRFNDNTDRPESKVIDRPKQIKSFEQQFIRCRETREFQRAWEKVFAPKRYSRRKDDSSGDKKA